MCAKTTCGPGRRLSDGAPDCTKAKPGAEKWRIGKCRRSREGLFINLSVRDLKRSMEFFRRLGFQFDPRFADDQAACMIS